MSNPSAFTQQFLPHSTFTSCHARYVLLPDTQGASRFHQLKLAVYDMYTKHIVYTSRELLRNNSK